MDNFVITTHKSCDPDGIGAELGLSFLLEKLGKRNSIINPDKTPERYLFLDPKMRLTHIDPEKLFSTENKNVIIVDNSDIPRIGDVQVYLNEAKSNLISIDHHDGVENFEGLFCFPEVGSTSEIIFELIELAGYKPDYITAYAIFAGIIVDTGQFKYRKTRPRTHQIAAKILELHQIPQEELIRTLYEDASYKVLLLKKDIYSTLNILPEEGIASVEIKREFLNKYGFTSNPAEGLTNDILGTSGINMAVSFVENDEKSVKLSFRSKGKYDICKIAKEFSGGGHTNAAGAFAEGSLEYVKAQVINKLKKLYLETKDAI